MTNDNKWITPVDVICYNRLTTYETRKQARDFYLRCMNCSEGSERDRYTNIFLSLTQSNDKMVHDGECEYYEEPTIFSLSKYNKNHTEDIEKLPEPMKYSEYLKYKQLQNEKDNLELD